MNARDQLSQLLASINVQRPNHDIFMAIFDAMYPPLQDMYPPLQDMWKEPGVKKGPAIENHPIAVIRSIQEEEND